MLAEMIPGVSEPSQGGDWTGLVAAASSGQAEGHAALLAKEGTEAPACRQGAPTHLSSTSFPLMWTKQ